MNRLCLKAKAKGLQEEVRQIRRKINKVKSSTSQNKNAEIYDLTLSKIYLGIEARHYHLARACIMGVPYKKIEFRCNSQPSVYKITNIIMELGYVLYKGKDGKLHRSHQTREGMQSLVEKWLKADAQKDVLIEKMKSTPQTDTQNVHEHGISVWNKFCQLAYRLVRIKDDQFKLPDWFR